MFSILGAVFLLTGLVGLLAPAAAHIALPFVVAGAACGGVGAPLLWLRAGELARRRRLLETGARANGTIVDVQVNYRTRVNRRHPLVVSYRFDASGREVRGQLSTFEFDEAPPKPGESVTVLYDPADPAGSNTIRTTT